MEQKSARISDLLGRLVAVEGELEKAKAAAGMAESRLSTLQGRVRDKDRELSESERAMAAHEQQVRDKDQALLQQRAATASEARTRRELEARLRSCRGLAEGVARAAAGMLSDVGLAVRELEALHEFVGRLEEAKKDAELLLEEAKRDAGLQVGQLLMEPGDLGLVILPRFRCEPRRTGERVLHSVSNEHGVREERDGAAHLSLSSATRLENSTNVFSFSSRSSCSATNRSTSRRCLARRSSRSIA